MRASLHKYLSEFYTGLRHWLQHTPAGQKTNSNSDIIVSEPVSKFLLKNLWSIFILEDCLQPLYLLLSANDTHALF